MTRAAALATAALLGAGLARAQGVPVPVSPAEPARYLLTTEAADTRALWVDPAGLARQPEASLGGELTADRLGSGSLELRQWGGTVASRGFAAGWLHHRYSDSTALDVYAIGFGLGDEQFSAGAVHHWYRGAIRGSGWDAGIRTHAGAVADVSLLVRNLGSPRLSDSTYWATLVPGALVRFLGGRAQLAGEWEIAPHGWRSAEVRFGGGIVLVRGLALLVRADLAPDLTRRAFAIALDFEGPRSRVTAFGSLPGGASEVDAFGGSAAFVARPGAGGR